MLNIALFYSLNICSLLTGDAKSLQIITDTTSSLKISTQIIFKNTQNPAKQAKMAHKNAKNL